MSVIIKSHKMQPAYLLPKCIKLLPEHLNLSYGVDIFLRNLILKAINLPTKKQMPAETEDHGTTKNTAVSCPSHVELNWSKRES